jgi:hypothetical protein
MIIEDPGSLANAQPGDSKTRFSESGKNIRRRFKIGV